ncbi:phage antirepressor KilAC domain-containing protein [Arthrobacter sp. SIMBA_036]|uniref:phage antirepressor n=1 Tax=Arthrobacter sp. SIMBA_036 TaxID=3085778 RepID=UPI00397D22B8
MTTLQLFNYGGRPVRTVLLEGEPHFVAGDVCDYFGVTNRNRAMQSVDQEDKGGTQIDTPGGRQTLTVINESGLYSLLFSLQPQKARGLDPSVIESKMEHVRKFKRWVTHEVLPSIRRTGAFGGPATPQTYAEALRELASSVEAQAALEAKIAADAPKVLFADSVATSETTILVGDLAKILRGNGVGVGANRLFAQLREDGYLIRRPGTDWNMPTQKAMELELFKVKETAVTHSDGHVTVSKTPKVTGKGQAYFINRYSPASKELAA